MKKDSTTAAARAAANTKCQFKFLWGPEPCEVFYVENDECPCPKSKHRSFFARKVSVMVCVCHSCDSKQPFYWECCDMHKLLVQMNVRATFDHVSLDSRVFM